MANENVNKSGVGFSVDKYDIYDRVDTFFKELNYDLVDTENNLWFLV